jgi:hypothetical protein
MIDQLYSEFSSETLGKTIKSFCQLFPFNYISNSDFPLSTMFHRASRNFYHADFESAILLFTPILRPPVRAGLVEKEEEYLWSSCGARYGARKRLLERIEFLTWNVYCGLKILR